MKKVILGFVGFTVGLFGLAFAQEPLPTQSFNGPPHYRLICHQAGRVISDQVNLDHILLYADQNGALHRVDFARDPGDWHTINIAVDTTCQVNPEE